MLAMSMLSPSQMMAARSTSVSVDSMRGQNRTRELGWDPGSLAAQLPGNDGRVSAELKRQFKNCATMRANSRVRGGGENITPEPRCCKRSSSRMNMKSSVSLIPQAGFEQKHVAAVRQKAVAV